MKRSIWTPLRVLLFVFEGLVAAAVSSSFLVMLQLYVRVHHDVQPEGITNALLGKIIFDSNLRVGLVGHAMVSIPLIVCTITLAALVLAAFWGVLRHPCDTKEDMLPRISGKFPDDLRLALIGIVPMTILLLAAANESYVGWLMGIPICAGAVVFLVCLVADVGATQLVKKVWYRIHRSVRDQYSEPF